MVPCNYKFIIGVLLKEIVMDELNEIRNMLKNIVEVDQLSNRAQLFLEGLKHSGKSEIAKFAISDECNAMLAAAKEKNYSALQQLMSQCK